MFLLVGCAEGSGLRPDEAPPQGERTEESAIEITGEDEEARFSSSSPVKILPSYGYTYGQSSGNRVTDGSGRLPDSSPIDMGLGSEPLWVVGIPLGDDTAWVVALEDGQVEAFRLSGNTGSVRTWLVSPNRLPAGQPPAVAVEGEKLRLLTSSGEGASALTHPVPLSSNKRGNLLVLAEDGALFAELSDGVVPVGNPQVRALPDARAVRGPGGRIAVLSDPTDRYAHSVLGDDLEAGSITVLEPGEEGAEAAGRIFAESGGVFELVSPLWFEGPNGEELLAITESVTGRGSRVAVYAPGGGLVTSGPFIGEAQKWRHLLAAGPFGPGGEVEIAAIRTPHVGGVVEFYGVDTSAGELKVAATRPGYNSHRIYNRNLDTARAGDFDGDGRWELLVPNQSYTELGAIRHEEGGAEVAWTLPVGGTLATNLAATTASDGRTSLAVGRAGGVLRIWP